MKAILNRLINHQKLSKEESRQMIINIADGQYNSSQIASFLTVYMMRSISLDELEGFRSALLELCILIDLDEYLSLIHISEPTRRRGMSVCGVWV